MSIDALDLAWSIQNLSTTEKFLLINYAYRANKENGKAWPSWEKIHQDTGLSRHTIAKNLNKLKEKGILLDTGERKDQVVVYKINTHLKLSTTSTKIATTTSKFTSTKNSTGSSTKIATTTSTKIAIRNRNKNIKRNRKENFVIFDVKELVKKTLLKSGLELDEGFIDQAVFYAEKSFDTQTAEKSVNIAVNIFSKGKWKIPSGYNGITSKSIREKEEKYEREKQAKIQQDSHIINIIKQEVATGNHVSLAERLRKLSEEKNADEGRLQANT